MLLTEYDEAKTMEMFKEEGREEGRAEGETKLGMLSRKLLEMGRYDDALRITSDVDYRAKMYAEFSMA